MGRRLPPHCQRAEDNAFHLDDEPNRSASLLRAGAIRIAGEIRVSVLLTKIFRR